MATVRDLSGNTNYLDPHIPILANTKLDNIYTRLGTLGTQTTLAAVLVALEAIQAVAEDPLPTLVTVDGMQYEAVAASQTDQMCGTTGAIGDVLEGVWIIPASTSPGAVSIKDGSTNTSVFAGGASSVSSLVPFFVPLGVESVSGGWEITTGASVSAIAVGKFT